MQSARGGDFLVGLGLGAIQMHRLDPRAGARRRAPARDQLLHAWHQVERLGGAAAVRGRDAHSRARGMAAELRGRLRPREVDDGVLQARVRARLGHHTRTPASLEVVVDGGAVTLTGPVPSTEADRLLAVLAAVPGVREVVDALERHETPGAVPALQGSAAGGW